MTAVEVGISAEQLQFAAAMARHLDDVLTKCQEIGVMSVFGFDLEYLAEHFEEAAAQILAEAGK